MDKNRARLLNRYIFGLFINDSIGYFVMVAILLASISAFTLYMPIIILALLWMLFFFMKNRRSSRLFKTDSYRITYSIARCLMFASLFSGVLSLVVLALSKFTDFNLGYLTAMLYFSVLYILPSIYFIFNWQHKYPNHSVFVTYTTLKYGHLFERLYLGQFIFKNDKRAISYILRGASLLIFLTWGYYAFIFVDWGVNSQDRIIFTTVPLVVLIIGIVDNVLVKNSKKKHLEAALEGKDKADNLSLHKVDNLCVRAMLFCGNKMYIKVVDKVVDQALHVDISTEEDKEAYNYDVKRIFNLKDIAHIFPLYNNEDIVLGSKVERYVIFVDSEDMVEPREDCVWVDVAKFPLKGAMCENFKYEWLRVLTFIVTLDVFNADGTFKDVNRPLANSVRLLDIVDKNIDFSDTDIMKLSIFNAHKPSYKFKRRWFSYIEGIID